MITRDELHHLQKLACISLPQDQEDRFLSQLASIVDFLGQLDQVKIDADVLDGSYTPKHHHVLTSCSGVSVYPDTIGLFANVKHEKIGNSIVVKSAVEE